VRENSEHHPMRCLRSSTCLEHLSPICSSRGAAGKFSPVFTSLWAAVEVNAVQTKYDIYWGAIAGLKKSP
jgi:hypothetical protein